MSKKKGKLFQQYETDPVAEVEGIWVTDLVDGFDVKIARWQNAKHREVIRRVSKPYEQQLERGTLSDKVGTELMIQGIATAIVTGWNGAEDADGNPLEFTYENVVQLLTDLPDLREEIAKFAQTQDLYRVQSIEEAVKNSKRSSAGSSGGGTSPTQDAPSSSDE